MEITEVRVKLVANQDDRLKAFCSMTLDNEFVIRDVKIIEGTGGLFVAMPSRKMSDHCGKCGGKNHLRAKFCTNCGAKLPENRVKPDAHGHLKLHADIAHPINASSWNAQSTRTTNRLNWTMTMLRTATIRKMLIYFSRFR
jgi:stage V sporulation protein G